MHRTVSNLRFIIISILLGLLFGCATAPTASTPIPVQSQYKPFRDAPDWLWTTIPEKDTLIFVTAGARRGNRDTEAYAALEAAALRAGVFAGFWGASQDFVSSSSQGTGADSRTRAHYDGAAEDDALANLEPTNLWRTDHATWVRFQLSLPEALSCSWTPDYKKGQPTWVYSPPEIPGWKVAVGLGAQQGNEARTLLRAEEDALAQMVQLLHGKTRTVGLSREATTATWRESQHSKTTYERGFGEVFGFLVLARWYDKKGQCWVLAACPEEKN
ncbi:MAG: hypothetical protein MI717_02020 [Spirochaetales bacterium]|nr:hypothetical protein [Spirochaetales bacterium]